MKFTCRPRLSLVEVDVSEQQDRATSEAVLEDEGWRILMRNDQYEFYLGG